ncbi:MAG: hydrogenase maturation protease [Candidatus Omnitrophica bacterium]|nr:hydrogenase maturation protease [Candidatus Omnitrophota bacterium]MBU1924252.1 hydrogenase maturation protease [Candidatus Omnitrophota bacterium]
MPKKLAVIGIGNTLRRDDGIGVIILESLHDKYKESLLKTEKERLFNNYKREAIDYLNFGISSLDLIYRLQDYDLALVIDGIAADLLPGELKIFSLEDTTVIKNNSAVSSHELNLKDIFILTRDFGIKTKIFVAGIQVQNVSFGESLSEPLKENLVQITKQIDKFIQERLL